MFESYRREREIRKALYLIARQRVVMVFQPGNKCVIENSPVDVEWFEVAVLTAHVRGWVAVLHDAMPSGTVRYEGATPVFPKQMVPKTQYRLTEGGWSVIHRAHGWTIATFFVSVLATLAAGVAAWVTWPK